MINIFKEDVTFRLTKRKTQELWIRQIIRKEGFKEDAINFIFCTDRYLRKINKQYLGHDYFTDIVTFDNSVLPKTISGDIYISIDRVKINANTYEISFNNELHRVMAHGVLHLVGYGDKNVKAKKVMREREDFWLKRIK